MALRDKERLPVDLFGSFNLGILYQSITISLPVSIGRLTPLTPLKFQIRILVQQHTPTGYNCPPSQLMKAPHKLRTVAAAAVGRLH